MTTSTSASEVVDRRQPTLRLVDRRLRSVADLLRTDHSPIAVRAARRVIEDSERILGGFVHDPWEPWAASLARARDILSSHLLAASACEGADVAPSVTATVLRRGAESASRLLA